MGYENWFDAVADDATDRLVSTLVDSRGAAVVLTGAGISAASGVPSFRGHSGLWEKYDPRDHATIQAFRDDPEKVWEMLWDLDAILDEATPNPAHDAIAELERLGVVSSVITQNVDGLHQDAGSREVIELHGSRRTLTCLDCARTFAREEVLAEVERGTVPRCRACGGHLKPDVVLFGEELPHDAIRRARQEVTGCDDLLVVGTAAEVEPAASLPRLAREEGARIWEINPEPNLPTDRRIAQPAEDALPEIVARVRKQRAHDVPSLWDRLRRRLD